MKKGHSSETETNQRGRAQPKTRNKTGKANRRHLIITRTRMSRSAEPAAALGAAAQAGHIRVGELGKMVVEGELLRGQFTMSNPTKAAKPHRERGQTSPRRMVDLAKKPMCAMDGERDSMNT